MTSNKMTFQKRNYKRTMNKWIIPLATYRLMLLSSAGWWKLY